MEFLGLGVGSKCSVLHSSVPPPPMLGRVEADLDLLIDPVRLGWYRSLRVLGHMISFISKIQARTGVVKNIRSRFCSEADLEKFFFV